jgi:hypothetical protein
VDAVIYFVVVVVAFHSQFLGSILPVPVDKNTT